MRFSLSPICILHYLGRAVDPLVGSVLHRHQARTRTHIEGSQLHQVCQGREGNRYQAQELVRGFCYRGPGGRAARMGSRLWRRQWHLCQSSRCPARQWRHEDGRDCCCRWFSTGSSRWQQQRLSSSAEGEFMHTYVLVTSSRCGRWGYWCSDQLVRELAFATCGV